MAIVLLGDGKIEYSPCTALLTMDEAGRICGRGWCHIDRLSP